MGDGESVCAKCKFGSFMATFDDGSHVEINGKPAILCSAPDDHPGLWDLDSFACFVAKGAD